MREGWRGDGVPERPLAPSAEETGSLPAVGDIVDGYRILGILDAGGLGQAFRSPERPPAPPAEEPDDLPAVGDLVGGYRILGRLGAGGMGQVFRAWDNDLERDVALKLLHPNLTLHPHAMSRFRREARLLAAVHHPNIATLFGTFEDGGTRFLVMELVDGETLARRLATGRMAVPEALGIARQIATALEAAHRKGIIHRDLKPANVMVSPEGWVKVLDFGLAKALSGEGGSSAAASEESRTQGALGTVPYMSPEQLCERGTDWPTDAWAFGCVLFELLTGKGAFTGKSRTDLARAILDAEPPWSELPARLPAPVVDLLRRCLAKDADLRPPMSQIRLVLEEALAGPARLPDPAEVDPATPGHLDGPAPVGAGKPIEPARAESPGLKPSLLDWARQKPAGAIAAAGALLLVLGLGLGILGLVTERAREGLIGLPPLSYSKTDLVLTGVQSLWSLPWRAVASLAASHPVLRGCAIACLLLAAALLAGTGFLRRGRRGRRESVVLAALAVSAGGLLAGAWLYSAAVHTGLATPGPGRGLACEGQLSRRWDVSAAFETCTWLINDTRRNEVRRRGLGGVLGLLLLAAGSGVWMGARSQGLGPRLSWARWGLVAIHGVLVLFFLRLVPAAHAYSTWGVSYPPVTVRTDLPGCDPALAQALAAGSCCAYNVSEDATEGTVLLLWGSGCPGGAGFKAADDVEAIGKGCLGQALTPQTVNSRCL